MIRLRIFLKLIYITVIAILGRILNVYYRRKIYITITIDAECRFEGKEKNRVQKNSYRNDFFESSKKIAEVCEENECRATYFVDYPEIEIFRDESRSPEKLIKELFSKGHDIQLHIHPSLINTEGSKDFSYYDENRIVQMLENGREVLREVIGVNPVIFRAGGYSVGEPEKVYRALVNTGFVADSSVFPGACNLHDAVFDFYGAPYDRWYYPFPDDFKKDSPEVRHLVEFPVTNVIRAKNNHEAYFFRFDMTKNIILLKIYLLYILGKRKKHDMLVNVIYHSKDALDYNGQCSHSLNNLKKFLNFAVALKKKNSNIYLITLKDLLKEIKAV